jgi:hypothetical protein
MSARAMECDDKFYRLGLAKLLRWHQEQTDVHDTSTSNVHVDLVLHVLVVGCCG